MIKKTESIIAFAIVVIIVVGVSIFIVFQGQNEDDTSKFIGTWNFDDFDVGLFGLMTLYSDGTGTTTSMMPTDLRFNWELKDGKFVMQQEGSNDPITLTYSFSDNGNKLTLTDTDTGMPLNLTKGSPEYLNLKTGDTVNINGEIGDVSYINTSYGSLPVISLNSSINIFTDAEILDINIYKIEGWYEALDIYSSFNEEYNRGDSIDVTLHFEEMQLNDAEFLWAKELGLYLKLPSAISQALDHTANIAGFYLKWISSDDEGHSSYEVFTTNKEQYSLNLFNVSLKKVSHDADLQENVVFSTLLNNTLNLFSLEYMFVTGMGEGIEKIDFMSSLNDGVSQNGFIEFIDKNSNGLIDDYDVFNLSIPPTEDDTKLETYLLLIGVDDLGEFSNIAAGVKYLINWYDGIYEQLTENEWIAINYTSHQENGTLVDTILSISRVNSKTNLSIDNFQVVIEYNDSELRGDLSEGTFIEEDNISVDFIDSNKNGLVDVDDLFLINGLENNNSVRLEIFNNQVTLVAYYPWITGRGYSREN